LTPVKQVDSLFDLPVPEKQKGKSTFVVSYILRYDFNSDPARNLF